MRRVVRVVLGVLVALTLAISVLATATRFVASAQRWLIMVAAFASYAVVGFLVVLVVCLALLRGARRRGRVLAALVVAVLGVAAHLTWLVPQYAGAGAGRADLSVMTANLEFGRGAATDLIRAVASDGVDVLVLEEVTPSALAALDRAGLGDLLDQRRGRPATGASGTMVFSRYPLGASVRVPLGNGGLEVAVGAPEPFTLLAVHTSQPVDFPGPWRVDMDTVRERAARAVAAGPTLVVGDLNATPDHVQLRRVLETGMRDAAEQAGSGWQPTWPTRWRRGWLRPLVALDHVLTSEELTAVRTRVLDVPGSDHRALVVDLRARTGDRGPHGGADQ